MKVLIKIWATILIIFFIVIGLCYCQSADRQYLSKGADYAAQGKFKEAKEEYEKALKAGLYPESVKDALRIIEDVSGKKIESKAAAHLFKGAAHITKRRIDEGIDEYNKAIEINPNLAMAYRFRGFAYAKKRQYDKAITDYTKAIEINPKLTSAYARRGFAYAQDKGQYDKAIADYNKAIEINPKCAEAYSNRGNTYYDKGQFGQAISDYNKAIEINPNLAEAYSNRGNTYYDKGQFGQAISGYNKAIEINPNLAEAYSNRGNTYYDKGQFDQTISDYNKAKQIISIFYYDKGQFDQTILNYTKIIEIDLKLANAYNNRGLAYYGKGQHYKAIFDYSKAIEMNPNLAEAYYNRANVYYAKDRFGPAISDYNKAIEINPKYADAYNNRRAAYYAKEHSDKAIEDYTNIVPIIAFILFVIIVFITLYSARDLIKARISDGYGTTGAGIYDIAEHHYTFEQKIGWSRYYLDVDSSWPVVRILMQKKIDSVDVSIFDCIDSHGEGSLYNATAILFESDQLNLPSFLLCPRMFYHKMLSLMGDQDIRIREFPMSTFSKKYLLQGGNEEKVRKLFNRRDLSYFGKNYGWSVEGKGTMLLVYRKRKKVDPKNIEYFSQQANMIFRLFL